MRVAAPLALLAVVAGATQAPAPEVSPWLMLVATLLTSGAIWKVLDRRSEQRIQKLVGDKTSAEVDNLTADVYAKMKRDVAEHLQDVERDMELRVAKAQAELAETLTRASEERLSLQRQLHAAEERHHEVVDEYRRRIRELEAEIRDLRDQLETVQARIGERERRAGSRRAEDP